MRRMSAVMPLFLISALHQPLPAQAVADGRWRAELTKSEGESLQLGMEVKHVADSLTLRLIVGTNAVPILRARQAGDTLRFTVPDEDGPADCQLIRRPTGSFVGTCLSSKGTTTKLTMTPPPSTPPVEGQPKLGALHPVA